MHTPAPAPERYERHVDAALTDLPPMVLVVEDDREMRRLLAMVVRQEGWHVLEASDGTEAAALLQACVGTDRRFVPDLVVTDVRLPGLSGLDVLTRLRLRDRITPVLVITAFGDDETHARARRLGAAEVLDKPFLLDDLRRAVRRLVNR